MNPSRLFPVATARTLFLASCLSCLPLLLPQGGWGADGALGKRLYDEKCQVCHGVKGDGRGPAGLSLTPKPEDFTRPKFWQGNYQGEIKDAIRKGRKMMPAFDLKDDEIAAIVEYMTAEFRKTAK